MAGQTQILIRLSAFILWRICSCALQCAWYLTNFVFDAFLGVFILWFFQTRLTQLAQARDWAYLKTPGGYGLESPLCYKWVSLLLSFVVTCNALKDMGCAMFGLVGSLRHWKDHSWFDDLCNSYSFRVCNACYICPSSRAPASRTGCCHDRRPLSSEHFHVLGKFAVCCYI